MLKEIYSQKKHQRKTPLVCLHASVCVRVCVCECVFIWERKSFMQLNQATLSVQFGGTEFSEPFLLLDLPFMINKQKKKNGLLFQI